MISWWLAARISDDYFLTHFTRFRQDITQSFHENGETHFIDDICFHATHWVELLRDAHYFACTIFLFWRARVVHFAITDYIRVMMPYYISFLRYWYDATRHYTIYIIILPLRFSLSHREAVGLQEPELRQCFSATGQDMREVSFSLCLFSLTPLSWRDTHTFS